MKRLRLLFMKLPPLFRYLLNSCFVTVIDVVIVYVLSQIFTMDIVKANTIGVVAGFLIDYFLSVLFVFEGAEGKGGFAIYLGTFLGGLVLADVLIYLGNRILFVEFSDDWNFLFSKGLSIVVPFFILYFIRKILYQMRHKRIYGGK